MGEDDFDAVLLRLKAQLGVHSDKEVAEALGMTPTAFNSRKSRGSFPEDKLYALAVRRPELGLDTGFVLSGRGPPVERPAPSQSGEEVVRRVQQTRGRYAPPVNAQLLGECATLVADRANALGHRLDVREVSKVAAGVYEMSLAAGSPTERLVDAMLMMFIAGRE